MHYLGCEGKWQQSILVVQVQKSNRRDTVELFEFWTRDTMIEKLGTEQLADDLIARHKVAESNLPPEQRGRYILVILVIQ